MSIETSHCSSSELSNPKKPALPPKPKLSLAESKIPGLEYRNSENSSYNALINSLREKLKTNGSSSENSLALSTLSSSSEIGELKSLNINQKMNDLSLLDEIYAEIEDKYLFHKPKEPVLTIIQSSCSCSHSSQSSQSSCSCSYVSESVDRPPLPSVPPPNLVNADSAGDKRISLSLEEEIALEIRAKLNQEFSVSKKIQPKTETIEQMISESNEKIADTPVLEPEYLEPILITKSEKKIINDKSLSRILSSQTSPKANSDFILSPSKLKSYLTKSPNSKSPIMDPNHSKTFSYLLKKSNQITSTLRLMRTKSSSNNVHNQSIYSEPVEQKFYQSSVNIFAEQNQVEISRPTLISQTFDLNKQSLIEIKHDQKSSGVVPSSSSFNSSFDTSSTSSVYSPKTECEHQFDDSLNECTKKFNDHSPTIESNLIITNVYEEDGKDNLRFICLNRFSFFLGF